MTKSKLFMLFAISLSFSIISFSQATQPITDTTKPVVDYDKVFTKVDQEAKFMGGGKIWKLYLEKNLKATVAADDGAPEGYYVVKVEFIVDKEGNVSNVKAVEVPKKCPSCGTEGERVIRKSPKWEPAIQDGRNVSYQAKQFITFQVSEDKVVRDPFTNRPRSGAYPFKNNCFASRTKPIVKKVN